MHFHSGAKEKRAQQLLRRQLQTVPIHPTHEINPKNKEAFILGSASISETRLNRQRYFWLVQAALDKCNKLVRAQKTEIKVIAERL